MNNHKFCRVIFTVTYIVILILLINQIALCNYRFKEDKYRQISYFKLDIEEINKKISNNNLIINGLTKELKTYDEDILKITELLNNIEHVKLDSAYRLLIDESEISNFSSRLTRLKDSFKQKILWLYKSGTNYGLEVLFTSSTFNDFYIRLEYLQKISQIRKKDFEKIKYYEYIVNEKIKVLNFSKKEKMNYISDKRYDQQTLAEKKLLCEKRLDDYKKENETLIRQINIKKNFIEKIEGEISLYKNEINLKLDQEINYDSFNFSYLEHKLIYPVNSMYILNDFDKNFNPSTWTLEYNNGIDFSIARNSEVKCVADGVIENISFIPGYGNVLIIKHSNDFRTIYGVIKEIRVKLNQIVKAGEMIAKTSDNLNGQCFHFEVWKNKSPLDPKKWIREY